VAGFESVHKDTVRVQCAAGCYPSNTSLVPNVVTNTIIQPDFTVLPAYMVSAVVGRVVGFTNDTSTKAMKYPLPWGSDNSLVLFGSNQSNVAEILHSGLTVNSSAWKYTYADPTGIADPTYSFVGSTWLPGTMTGPELVGGCAGITVLVQRVESGKYRGRVVKVLEVAGERSLLLTKVTDYSDMTTSTATALLNATVKVLASSGTWTCRTGPVPTGYEAYPWMDEYGWAVGGSRLTDTQANTVWNIQPDFSQGIFDDVMSGYRSEITTNPLLPDLTEPPSWDDTSTGTPVENVKSWYSGLAGAFEGFRSWFFFLEAFN
jgi:hypothetical protein